MYMALLFFSFFFLTRSADGCACWELRDSRSRFVVVLYNCKSVLTIFTKRRIGWCVWAPLFCCCCCCNCSLLISKNIEVCLANTKKASLNKPHATCCCCCCCCWVTAAAATSWVVNLGHLISNIQTVFPPYLREAVVMHVYRTLTLFTKFFLYSNFILIQIDTEREYYSSLVYNNKRGIRTYSWAFGFQTPIVLKSLPPEYVL